MKSNYKEQLNRLLRGELAAEEFTHVDHVGVAYEALDQYDFFHASAHVASGLQALAAKAGAPEKFNATITAAFMSLIAERMKTTEYKNVFDFIERNGDLARGSALAPFYSKERLNSAAAKDVALLPDLLQPAPSG